MRLFVVLAVLIMISTAAAFDISSSNPSPGEKVTISGSSNPGQEVKFRSSFSLDLPVQSGRYEYVASGVEIPQKPNKFSVTASGVKDLNVGVKIGIWISKGFAATNGAASISQSDVPPGRYDLKVFGGALDGKESVKLDIAAETAVKADSTGSYSLSIDTSGIAAGAYKIEGGGETKVIQIGGSTPTSSSPSSSAVSSSAPSSPAPVTSSGEGSSYGGKGSSSDFAITSDVISWYAKQADLDPTKPKQYIEAENGLEYRLKGGYWKLIARGDSLTEKAGNCQDDYCLVRGVDACTSCREIEILLQAGQKSALGNDTGANASGGAGSKPIQTKSGKPATENLTGSQVPIGEETGFIGWFKDILMGILRFVKGG